MARKKTNFEEEFAGADNAAEETVEGTETTEGTENNEGTEDAGEGTDPSTDLPKVEEAKEKESYELADGTIGSRAAFIREKFLTDNMSRKEIAETFGFQYRVVYSATVNMENGAEATTRGRSASNASIKVNAENQIVEVKEIEGANVTFVNGEVVDKVFTEEELSDKLRNTWIKEVIEAGMSRGDVAKILDLSYGVIYSLTKEAEGTRVNHTITLEDGTEVSRAEYIRMQAAAGVARGDIAKELNVPYSVVWQATKTEKSDQEKFTELVKTLETYKGKVSDEGMLDDALATLKEISILETEEDKQDSAEAEQAENDAVASTEDAPVEA